ncbi:JmjC domain-containing histone demethylation protein 1 [Actinomortierella ambigua]|uniref:JmjC domain-containing histone demethylation protein 1 n=1 Tax=Actinomortierella ambigua TaxID=1343610 RepID=A0A9P6QIZ1_9FUNG|nr:JmjC domain-containing histone demethylation protein 1 [Actinomortierella ambigua]
MEDDDQETCILCPEDGLGNTEATWICCDACNEWYHIRCIKMPLDEFETVDKYHCKRCQNAKRAGPTTYVRKSSRKTGRVNYADLQNGHVNTESKWKVILDSQRYLPDTFERVRGSDITLQRLRTSGFTAPLIIKKGDQDYSTVDGNGLEMAMPPSSFTVRDVRDAVGKETPVEVVDVATQSEVPGYDMERWADYFGSEHKERIYNVISLEISDTKLAEQVVRPRIVREMDWIENYWPANYSDEFPKVQLYCLMSVAGSYTDFHIDFAGSSVYYHILSGSKTFYFVEPTPSNLKKYAKWSNSADQASTFFASEVNGKCYKVDLEQGDTMLLPTGWIHSVYTPKDSIVIGGNFLHSLNIPTQFNIAAIEIATNVPRKFRFPYFDKMNWFVALGYIKRGQDNLAQVSIRELHGIVALTLYLNQKRVDSKTDPKLSKEERHAIRASIPPEASQFADGGSMGLLRELNRWCFEALQSRGEVVDDSKRLATMMEQENSISQHHPQQGSAAPKIKLRLKIKSTSSTTSVHSDDDDRNSASGEQRVPVADPNATSPITPRAPVKVESPSIKPGKLTIKLKPSPEETGGSAKLKLTIHHAAKGSDGSESNDDDEDDWDDLERAIQGSDDEFDPLGDDDEMKAEEEDYMHSSDSEYDEGRSSSKRSATASGRSRKRSRTSSSGGGSPSSQSSASTAAFAPKHKKTESLDAGTRLAQLSTMTMAHPPPAQRAQAETVFFGDDETGADPLFNGSGSDEGDSSANRGGVDLGRRRKMHGGGGASDGQHYSKGANANYNRSILGPYSAADSKKPKKVVGQTARERLANKLLRR